MGRALEGAPQGGVLHHAAGGAGKCPPGLLRPGGGHRAVAGRAGEGDIAIGGATLAAEAAASDLIDEYLARVYPVLVGGNIPLFPQRERRVDLELVETRTFSSRVVHLRYRVARRAVS
ncbi:dihydrofolate reductase family protein [Nonomuraea sp. ZG12]|uniref:dihydrofolate reductase family protein n=1 Tax=Nonomuraea sp. ZG12 TaxID=3452207 RepID=UPI003F8914CA